MDSKIQNFLEEIKKTNSIEIVADHFFNGTDNFYREEGEMALAKSYYKDLLQISIQNFLMDKDYWSFLSCLLSSRDDRAWYYRRQLLLDHKTNYSQEQHIYHLALTIDPKTSLVYETIRWYLTEFFDLTILQEELTFLKKIAEKDSSNARLWSHIVWCMQKIPNSHPFFLLMFDWAKQFIRLHPSNISAFSFLQTFCPSDIDSIKTLFCENTLLLFELPGHETIWTFRRFLLSKLKSNFSSLLIPYQKITKFSDLQKIKYPSCDISQIKDLSNKISHIFHISLPMSSISETESYNNIILELSNELDIITLALSDNSISEFENQQTIAKKYMKWILYSFL